MSEFKVDRFGEDRWAVYQRDEGEEWVRVQVVPTSTSREEVEGKIAEYVEWLKEQGQEVGGEESTSNIQHSTSNIQGEEAELEFHPVADLFPLMEGEEFERLKEDIGANGLMHPILTGEWAHQTVIVDGRNRYRACRELGWKVSEIDQQEWLYAIDTTQAEHTDLQTFVVSSNLHRRHLTDGQRSMIAAKIATWENGQNQYTTGEGLQICRPSTQTQAAEQLDVSVRSVATAKRVIEGAIAEVQALVETGQLAVSAAEMVAGLEEHEQRELAEEGPEGVKEWIKKVREAKKKEEEEGTSNSQQPTANVQRPRGRGSRGDRDVPGVR